MIDKAVSRIMLTLLFLATLTLGFNIQQSEALDPPATEWTRTYGGSFYDEAYALVETSDGAYVVAGYTWSFGAGGRDFWLLKIDSSGTLQWNKTYGGADHEIAESVVETSDGGYLIAGVTTSYGVGGDAWLVKTDSSGNHQWNKTYGGNLQEGARCVIETSDGYVIAGSTFSVGAGNADAWLVKTDSSGNHQWNKTYGGVNGDGADYVVATSDGGYALAGGTNSFGVGGDAWLVKTDSSGNHQWNKTYGGAESEDAYCVIETSDGGYALSGYSQSSEGDRADFWLVKTNSSGNMQWEKKFGTSYDLAYSVVETPDGGYAVAGHTFSVGAGYTDAWLVKTDSSGNHQWNKTYGGADFDDAKAVILTSDGGYVLAGQTYHSGMDYPDFFVVKLMPPDWWPMFHHDLTNTGYATSTAPNINNTIWNYTTGDLVRSSPAVAEGKVYVGSWDSKVYCLNAADGVHIWNYTTGDLVLSSPAVADGKVYVGSNDGKVYCLNAADGVHIWNYTIGSQVQSSPAVAYGKVYVGSNDGKVYCLNAADGVHIWNYTTTTLYGVESSPAVADGKVYVGSYDRKVYALNASTGTFIWSYTTGNYVRSSPAVADGKVYVGSNDGKVYCLNAADGVHIWNYTTGDRVRSSPAVAEGKVYVGSDDRKVYCFGPSHDLAVTNVTTSKTGCLPIPTVGQGYNATVNVTVENQGDFTETFDVTVYANTSIIGTQTNIILASGENTTLTFTWDTTSFVYGNYTISANATILQDETDVADNTYTDGKVLVSIPGDVDGDRDVDVGDQRKVQLAMFSYPGDPNWNPNMDIDGDLDVDVGDQRKQQLHMFESW